MKIPLDSSSLAKLLQRGRWRSRPELLPITDAEWTELAEKLVFDPEIEELAGLRRDLDDCFVRFFRTGFTQALVRSKALRSELQRVMAACDLILLCGRDEEEDRALLDAGTMAPAARIILRRVHHPDVRPLLSKKLLDELGTLRGECEDVLQNFEVGRPSRLPTQALVDELVELLDAWILDAQYMRVPSNRRVIQLDATDDRDSPYAEENLLTPFVAFSLSLAARKAQTAILGSELPAAQRSQAAAYFAGYTKRVPTTLPKQIRAAYRKLPAGGRKSSAKQLD